VPVPPCGNSTLCSPYLDRRRQAVQNLEHLNSLHRVLLGLLLVAEPTKDLDARWGGVPSWTVVDLLPIIYAELTQ